MAGYGYDDRVGRWRGVTGRGFRDPRYGSGGPSGQQRWEEDDEFADGGDWSRPEFNLSLGAYRARGRGLSGEIDGWWVADLETDFPGAGREWRTGEPWGGGYSAADRIRARDLMTENPEAVTPETTLSAVAERMRDLDVGIMPVVDDHDRNLLQGVITDRDIVVRAVAEGRSMTKTQVRDFMSSGVSTVHESDSVRDLFSVMKREQVRRVPVVDEAGRLVGIVALADLAVDYAELNLDRELEVEEVVQRISEPARPRSAMRPGGPQTRYDEWAPRYDRDLGDRVRERWRNVKRGARHFLRRDYHRDYHPGAEVGWR